MNWGVCNSGSHNVHDDFPPIMNDGRNFASWLPNGEINENIRTTNNIKTNNNYRQYLMKNADTIIQYNQFAACDECNASVESIKNKDSNNNSPFLFKSSLDQSKPIGYETSDLKESYLSKHQLQARLVTPVLNQENLLMNGFHNYH